MKIVHLVSEYGSTGKGVPQKIIKTVETWQRLGLEANFIDFASGNIGKDGISKKDFFVPHFRAEWIFEMHRRSKRVREVLHREKPDLIYTREMVWNPGLMSILREFSVVIEVNSDRGKELRPKSLAASAFWDLTSSYIRRRAAGLVFVTNELAIRLGSTKYVKVIGNAVSVPSSPPKRTLSSSRPLVLMLVGSPSPWVGLDRFASLSQLFPEFDFVICGDIGRYAEDLPESVRVIPPCSGKVLESLLSMTSVSFSTLALSRKGMTEACPLKSRTSLAAGIPLIYAHEDPALQGNEPFALRIKDRQQLSQSTLNSVKDFIQKASEKPEIGIQAWEFAKMNLDFDIVEKERINFFKSII